MSSHNHLYVGNINVTSNTISSTNSNGSISILPDGNGEVLLKADPITTFGAATKQYVDAKLSGLTFKSPARVITETALPSYTQSGSGVGATLTAIANNSINNTGIDGVTNLALNERVLVDSKGSTNDLHNGVYYISQVGDASNPWILTRSTDFDQDAEVVSGTYVLITDGVVNKDFSYVISTADPISVDSTAIEFVIYSPFSGETNTASNVGAGVGVFKQKTETDLEFKSFTSNSTHITVTDDIGNSEIDLAFVQSEITGTGALDAGSITANFGSINIGTSSLDAGAATFTSLTADDINTTTISSTGVNGNISITPNGIGEVLLKADPISVLGAATKQYVDNAASGLNIKDPVRVITVVALPSYTQSGSGIGATLTATANGSINSIGIDGVTDLALTDRVLVESKGSTNDSHNGIYTLTQVGDGSNPWILTRATDYDETSDIVQGTYTLITEGTIYGGSSWTVATSGTITVDTTDITYTQFTVPSASVVASNEGNGGVGIFKQKTGNTLEFNNINSTNSAITIALDAANNEVDLTFDQTQITGTGAIDSGSITSNFGSINIGTSSIDAGAATFDSATIGNILLDGSTTTYSGTTGANIVRFPNNLTDALSYEDDLTNTYLQFVSSTGSLEVKILQNLNVVGTIVTSSTVNGRDVSTDGTQLDSIWATGVADLTATEVNQLENINAVTISNTQWGYLGAADQGIATTDAVTFTDTTLSGGNLTFTGTTTNNTITAADNLADGLRVRDAGGTDYIKFITTNGSENIEVLQTIDFSNRLMFKDITAPSNPSSGEGLLYKKTGNDGIFWKPDASGVEVDLTTAPQYNRTTVNNAASPYTVLATDEIIGVNSSSGAVTVTLPEISTIGGTNNYRKYYIVDEEGTSSINNITVGTSGSDTINKETDSLCIDIDHTSITLYNDGTSNWIIL
jgi:hypothetical protein